MPTPVESSAETQLEVSKTVVRSFIDAWNTRDFDRFEALMGDGAVLRIGGAVVPCDPQATRAIAEQWTSAFPDWHFDLLALIAEGDRVVAHMPYRGTHCQAILGVAPTGRSCTVDEIVIFRVADGKIAEAWEVYDEAGMWRQLGVSPVMATDPANGEPGPHALLESGLWPAVSHFLKTTPDGSVRVARRTGLNGDAGGAADGGGDLGGAGQGRAVRRRVDRA